MTEKEKVREHERVDREKLLGVLQGILPTWEWNCRNGDFEHVAYFFHKNFLNEEIDGDPDVDEKLYAELVMHGVATLAAILLPSDTLVDLSVPSYNYYDARGAEMALIVYRAWARRRCEEAEYTRVNELIMDYFQT